MKIEQTALGMIETWGVPALIAAADAAAKAADVTITAYDKADAGLVTVYIRGDVASVKAAVDAGAAAANQIGKVVGVHVIPRPDTDIAALINKAVPTSTGDKLEAKAEATTTATTTKTRERRPKR